MLLIAGFLGLLAACAVVARVRAATARRAGAGAAMLAAFSVFAVQAQADWLWECTAVGALGLSAAVVAAMGIAGARPRGPQPVRLRAVGAILAVCGLLVALPEYLATTRLRASEDAVAAGSLGRAGDLADSAASFEPWAASPVAQQSRVAEARKDYRDAISRIDVAIAREPTNWRHRIQLARIDAKAGRPRPRLRRSPQPATSIRSRRWWRMRRSRSADSWLIASELRSSVRVQLWSYNYDPEPLGIAPIASSWARAMRARGHEVEVVAAHPHYPEPEWGVRLRPYRENRDGVHVLRLPIWPGRAGVGRRVRQELSYGIALMAAAPFLRRPDAVVAVSPSFPALLPTMAFARHRRLPWVLWLQDILPDGAVATGMLDEGPTLRALQGFEVAAYRSARKIVVISESFRRNLEAKAVPQAKIARVYNPVSRVRATPRPAEAIDRTLVLSMGNIGHTQNLPEVVRSFEASQAVRDVGARMVITGDGVASEELRAAIVTERVAFVGVVEQDPFERLLSSAAVGLVSQRYDGADFNLPSRLMNFMGHGVPVVAAVRPDSEVARIVRASNGGWVTSTAEECAATLACVLGSPPAILERGAAALEFARRNFSPGVAAAQFETLLEAESQANERPVVKW